MASLFEAETGVLEGVVRRVLPLVNLEGAALRHMTTPEAIPSGLDLWHRRIEPMSYCEKCEEIVLDEKKHSKLGHRTLKLLY